MKFLLMIIMHL